MFFVSACVWDGDVGWNGGMGEWPCTYLLQVAARLGTINLSSKGRMAENGVGAAAGQGDKSAFYLLF